MGGGGCMGGRAGGINGGVRVSGQEVRWKEWVGCQSRGRGCWGERRSAENNLWVARGIWSI